MSTSDRFYSPRDENFVSERSLTWLFLNRAFFFLSFLFFLARNLHFEREIFQIFCYISFKFWKNWKNIFFLVVFLPFSFSSFLTISCNHIQSHTTHELILSNRNRALCLIVFRYSVSIDLFDESKILDILDFLFI